MKAKKNVSGKYIVSTCYELSKEQLVSMGFTLPGIVEGETVARESKAPKWFTEWSNNVFEPRLNAIEKDIKDMKNTPTMKKELSGK